MTICVVNILIHTLNKQTYLYCINSRNKLYFKEDVTPNIVSITTNDVGRKCPWSKVKVYHLLYCSNVLHVYFHHFFMSTSIM